MKLVAITRRLICYKVRDFELGVRSPYLEVASIGSEQVLEVHTLFKEKKTNELVRNKIKEWRGRELEVAVDVVKKRKFRYL